MSELKPFPITSEEAIDILQSSNTMLKSHIDEITAFVHEIPMGDSPYNNLDYCNREYEAVKLAIAALRRAQPAHGKAVRPIDANTLSDEISRLQIFLVGESLFTPAIKESVLRTIDEQATVAAAQPANEPLTLEKLREMDGEPVWVICGIYADWRIPEFIDEGAYKGFIKFSDRSAEPIPDYGKNWLAYRRKPEKEDNDGQH